MLILILIISNLISNNNYYTDYGILPKNNLWISANDKVLANKSIDEEKFHQIIDDIAEIYRPVIRDQNAQLVIEKNWESGTVNAYAER